jgi:DNA-binding LytR/AlgR family response regulator
MEARFIINDGQHRRAAIIEALKQRPDLDHETIAVVFFLDIGLDRCQQMFADLNRHAIRPSRSLGLLYDHRNDKARLAKLVTRLQRHAAQHGAAALPAMQEQVQAMLRQLAVRAEPPAAPALDWLQVDQGRQVRMLHVDDVMYFESDSKYTRVVAEDCDGLIRLSLKELLNSLDPQAFVQVHRSVIVNRRFVHSVHRRGEQMELQIQGRDERVRVSESNQSLFRAM